MVVETEFRLNFQDLKEAELKEFQTSRFWKLVLRVIFPLATAPLLLCAGFTLFAMEPAANSPISQTIFAEVPTVRLLLLLPFILIESIVLAWLSHSSWSPIPSIMAREKLKAGSGFSGVHQVAIDENNLTWRNNGSTKTFNWSDFESFSETQSLFYLYQSHRSSSLMPKPIKLLPKRAFQLQELADLRHIMARHLAEL